MRWTRTMEGKGHSGVVRGFPSYHRLRYRFGQLPILFTLFFHPFMFNPLLLSYNDILLQPSGFCKLYIEIKWRSSSARRILEYKIVGTSKLSVASSITASALLSRQSCYIYNRRKNCISCPIHQRRTLSCRPR